MKLQVPTITNQVTMHRLALSQCGKIDYFLAVVVGVVVAGWLSQHNVAGSIIRKYTCIFHVPEKTDRKRSDFLKVTEIKKQIKSRKKINRRETGVFSNKFLWMIRYHSIFYYEILSFGWMHLMCWRNYHVQ